MQIGASPQWLRRFRSSVRVRALDAHLLIYPQRKRKQRRRQQWRNYIRRSSTRSLITIITWLWVPFTPPSRTPARWGMGADISTPILSIRSVPNPACYYVNHCINSQSAYLLYFVFFVLATSKLSLKGLKHFSSHKNAYKIFKKLFSAYPVYLIFLSLSNYFYIVDIRMVKNTLNYQVRIVPIQWPPNQASFVE